MAVLKFKLKQLTSQPQTASLPEGASLVLNLAALFWFDHLSLKFRVTVGLWSGTWDTTAQHKHRKRNNMVTSPQHTLGQGPILQIFIRTHGLVSNKDD